MNRTRIEYVTHTWNWMSGCTNGCEYCYARRQAHRFPRVYPNGFAPTFRPNRLDEPLHVRQPARVLTCSMGDFACGEYEWFVQSLGVMAATPEHEYLLLTKGPDLAAEWLKREDVEGRVDDEMARWAHSGLERWPLPNVWIGTSVQDQPSADKRIPQLFRLAGWSFWVSVEPLLGPINLRRWLQPCGCGGLCDPGEPCSMACNAPRLRWVVVGAQTGPGAVAPKRQWVEGIINQCRAASVPVFVKDNVCWPEPIREFPEVRR